MALYPIDLGTAPNGDPWELDLRNNGSGWTGTFAGLVRDTVQAIIENGHGNDRSWFVEVTLADGTARFGVLDVWMDQNTFIIDDDGELPMMVVEVDDVVRFRA